MASSTTKAAGSETQKPQASAPNFVLSVLATCSSAMPVPGVKGEATLSEQLAELLQGNAVAIDELNLLYSYRYGFSISDALNFVGFDGKLQDFINKQKKFYLQDGQISLKTDEQAMVEAESPLSREEYTQAKGADDEAASLADTESTVDAESCHLDSDSDVDIIGWQSLGNRLVAALDSTSDDEADENVARWKSLGGRISSAFLTSDDEEEIDMDSYVRPDAAAWRSIGTRVLNTLDHAEVMDDF